MGKTAITTPQLNHIRRSDWDYVYEPAEDSFLLLDALEADLDFLYSRRPAVVVEVGSGSGIIITALSGIFNSSAHCLAIDINKHACKITKSTSDHNKTDVDVIQGDLTSCLKDFSIDMIVFNPPYVVTPSSEVSFAVLYLHLTPGSFEKAIKPLREAVNAVDMFCCACKVSSGDLLTRSWAGGADGTEVINKFLATFANKMGPKSFGYLLLLKENQRDRIIQILNGLLFECEIISRRKVPGEELFVVKFVKTN